MNTYGFSSYNYLFFGISLIIIILRKKAAEIKFVIGNNMQGAVFLHLLSLHNRTGLADTRSTLASCRLKYTSASKNLVFIYLK